MIGVTEHLVPQSAEWYVKSALTKAVLSTLSELQMLRRIATDPKQPSHQRQQAHGLHNHHVQWIKEAVAEFKKLDSELIPNFDALNVEVEYLDFDEVYEA